jgi:hypothetical protein
MNDSPDHPAGKEDTPAPRTPSRILALREGERPVPLEISIIYNPNIYSQTKNYYT